jgi:hypothetical protein
LVAKGGGILLKAFEFFLPRKSRPWDRKARDVRTFWLRKITDETGFEIIYVAALRSVGVPARLDIQQRAEFWDGGKWTAAPPPSVISW